MRSRSAVFHNRFIVVHPFYNPDDPSTFESDRARASPRLWDERRVRREDRLQLVLERQQLQAQQIQTLQVSLRRRQELLAKYAALSRSLPEAQRGKLQQSLTKLMTAVYGDADALYELLKTSGKAAQTSEADAETEVRALLEAACKEFEGTFLQDVLRKEVTAHLIALFQKQMTIQRRSLKREAGRTDAERAARGAFAIDNRSRSVVVRNLADDVTERDVVNSLAGFFGVKNIQKEGAQATIEFDEPWQTKKPMQTGLLIGKSVGAGIFSHA